MVSFEDFARKKNSKSKYSIQRQPSLGSSREFDDFSVTSLELKFRPLPRAGPVQVDMLAIHCHNECLRKVNLQRKMFILVPSFRYFSLRPIVLTVLGIAHYKGDV